MNKRIRKKQSKMAASYCDFTKNPKDSRTVRRYKNQCRARVIAIALKTIGGINDIGAANRLAKKLI